MSKLVFLMTFMLVGFAPVFASAEEERRTDHEALRAILKDSTEAINTNNFDLLRGVLSEEHFTVITVDNQKFESLEGFSKYWNQLFEGENAPLKRIEVAPTADKKTVFLADNVGVAEGTSNETYYFTNGNVRTMQTRWTAVAQKDNGIWKLVKVHFSANVLDNPLLDAAKEKALQFIVAAALAGLVIGMILKGLISCCRKTA